LINLLPILNLMTGYVINN